MRHKLDEAPIYVDGTVGAAGHTSSLLSQHAHAKVIGVDRDSHMVDWCQRNVQPQFPGRLLLEHANYGELSSVLQRIGALLCSTPTETTALTD